MTQMLSPGLSTCISVWSLSAGRPQLWCLSCTWHTSTSHMSSWMTKVSSCSARLCSHALVVSHSYHTLHYCYSIITVLVSRCIPWWHDIVSVCSITFALWPYIDIAEQFAHCTMVHPSLLMITGCAFSASAQALIMMAFGSLHTQ